MGKEICIPMNGQDMAHLAWRPPSKCATPVHGIDYVVDVDMAELGPWKCGGEGV